MDESEIRRMIIDIVSRIISESGDEVSAIEDGTVFLGGDLPIDSLALALLITELEEVALPTILIW